ncbi:hypothetical protein JD844_033609 [Phrynosoma platyrhinos]|uniref:Uncharacterized protein n=1 Tax=Phrynosoma platyrhinos TaxID=52577 RepID=A0ABQ7T6J4_PHRPL|nr:hypothetical protein JD844_033609 [Phrynosoma platyrhinos]
MDTNSVMPLIFLQGATIVVATQCRTMTRNFISLLGPRLFLLEMLATFQLCSCFNILHPLTELEPKPQLYLGHIYSFAALHFYLTLNENTSNPASILVYILRKGISMKLGMLKIVAQFIGAFLAMFYQNMLWSFRTSSLLSNPRICSHPLQTDLFKAFCTELITSFMFQLAILKSQLQELRVRANRGHCPGKAQEDRPLLPGSGHWAGLAMALAEGCISLLVMALTVMGISGCRRLVLQSLPHRSQTHGFFLELTGAFQIAACTHELRLLADLPPKPHLALALTYLFTALHGLTLLGSLNNPSSSFQLFFKGRLTAKAWGLQTAAQFTGALLANIYIRLVWILGIIPVHSRALAENCTGPIQTTIANAFVLELLFSFLLHLTLLQFESMNHKTKSHLVALLITALVYEAMKPSEGPRADHSTCGSAKVAQPFASREEKNVCRGKATGIHAQYCNEVTIIIY